MAFSFWTLCFFCALTTKKKFALCLPLASPEEFVSWRPFNLDPALRFYLFADFCYQTVAIRSYDEVQKLYRATPDGSRRTKKIGTKSSNHWEKSVIRAGGFEVPVEGTEYPTMAQLFCQRKFQENLTKAHGLRAKDIAYFIFNSWLEVRYIPKYLAKGNL